MIREPEGCTRWMPQERTWGEFVDSVLLKGMDEFSGSAVLPNLYLETYACTNAKPILQVGDETAGAMNSSGSGLAILLGTLVGHGGTAYRTGDTSGFIKRLLNVLGIDPLHPGVLQVRRRSATGRQALIVTNPTSKAVNENLDIADFTKAADPLGGKVEVNGHLLSIEVAPLDVRLILLEKQIGG